MQLQIAVKLPILCCHLVNPNNERFRLLPHYFGPCYYGSTEYKYPILFIEYVQNTEWVTENLLNFGRMTEYRQVNHLRM